MKNTLPKLTSILLSGILMISFTLTSCDKEGPTGLPGKDGSDGKDANIQCGVCHNSTSVLQAIQFQYHNSQHYNSEVIARNTNNCAACHTGNGFHQAIANGTITTDGTISNPTPVNCRTCHKIHTKYDATDYALTYIDEVTYANGNGMFNHGKGNLCVRCHQLRPVSPMPVINGEAMSITSNRWGPHYNAAGNVYEGKGAIELPGEAYNQSPHKNMITNACVDCHMHEPIGTFAGGHTFKMTWVNSEGATSRNVASCNVSGCHTGLTNFDYSQVQTTVKGLLTEIRAELLAKNYITPDPTDHYDHDYPKASTATPLQIPANHAAALYNYLLIARDGSYGVHNTKYTLAVLRNSLAALKA